MDGWRVEWITNVDVGVGGLDVSADMEIWNLDHEFDKLPIYSIPNLSKRTDR